MTPDWAEGATDVPHADFGNPQSLNLYAYALNNPITTADPDGHGIDCAQNERVTPCPANDSTADDDNEGLTPDRDGMIRVTATGHPEQTQNQPSGLSVLEEIAVRSLNDATQAVQQAASTAAQWFSQPRNPGCMAASMGAGSATGAVVGGVVGFAGAGVGEFALSPAGAGIGAGVGYTAGMVSCMSGNGGGGGGGGGGGSSAKDNKKADDLIPGGQKRSLSYHSEYGQKTYKEIKELARTGDQRAQQMKKLIEQAGRLGQRNY
jgi:hypothetical protein